MIKKFTQSISVLSTKWLVALALPFFAFQVAQAQLNYVAVACNDAYVQAQGQAGTTLLGSGDDAVFANVALPFAFQVYSTSYTTVNIGTNGFVVLLPGTNRGLGNTNLPTATAGAALYPFWDDLDINPVTAPNAGVYTRVDGTAPNRVFTIEWFNAGHFPDAANQTITFQVRLFENTTRIQYKYQDVIFGGGQAGFNSGLSATVGLEGPLPAPRPNTVFSFNTASLTDGQCIEWILPQACNPIPGATVNVNTVPGLCSANAVVALPTFNPAGCANGTSNGLRYSVNGGAFINVPLPAANVTIPNLPSGNNVITWQTFLIANGATTGSATQLINVVDNEKPIITCPPNVNANLAPGECCQIISWNLPTVTDNCPFIQPAAPLFTTTAGNPANFFNAFAGCTFDLRNDGTQPIVINGFRVPITDASAQANISVYFTTTASTNVGNQTNAGAWTLLGSVTTPTNQATAWNVNTFTQVNVGGLTLQPGQSKGIYIVVTNYPTGGTYRYTNGSFTATDGKLAILSNGFAGNVNFGNTFASRAWVGEVQYATGGAAQIVQTTGPASGSEFCKDQSPYTITYQVADGAGNTATCAFTINVNEYANPITTLTCNDFVYISLDESCQYTIGADQVLEGGPYGCYDDYIVQLDKTPPYGNGPWGPAILGPQDIGKTYAVQVIDPETGNKCWGNLKVEDKLAPVLDCPDGLAVCSQDFAPGSSADNAFGSSTTLPTSSQTVNNGFNGVTFDIRNDGAAPILITGFTAPVPGGVHPVNVYFTTTATTAVGNQTNASAWTLLGTANVTGNGAFPNYAPLANVPIGGIQLAPGQRKGIYIAVTDGSTFGYANGDLTTTNGTLTIINQGHAAGAFPFINANTPRAFIGSVIYKTVVQPIPFPNGLVLNETVFPAGNKCYTVPAGAGSPVLENCSDVTLCYQDSEVPQDCATGLEKIINRKWTATDASGNTKTCIQKINVLRPTLGDIVLPPDYDDVDEPALNCGGQFPTPAYIESLGLQGFPEAFGSSNTCSINYTYDDVVIEVCDGTYKILRKWDIVDWCAGTSQEVTQIIKVLDKQGPSISCPANLTVSTDPFSCCAVVNLPDVIVSDNCSRINNISGMIIGLDQYTGDTIGMFPIGGSLTNFPGNNLWHPDTLGAFGLTPCLPVSPALGHVVVYQAEDDCGNTSTCSFRLIVRDLVPPVAACTEFTTVAIGVDDPYDCYGPAGFLDVPPALDACSGAGVTWVKAKTFDQGSYDNCNNVKFTIQRMAPYSDCIQNLNSINGFLPCNDQFPDFPSEYERATAEQDSIKFYCCEVGTTQTVILRVYQLDANGNFTIGQDGTPVHNSCMIEVEVQDKIKPVCLSPGNVTVSCEAFDPSLWAYGKPAVYDNCCLDTSKVYQGQCGLEHLVNYNQFDTVCNKGTITRTFRVYDCHGNPFTQCTQRIVVTYEQDYWIKFPNDVVVTTCDGTQNYGEPVFNWDQDCELLGVSFEDQIFTVVPDACFKIERTWTIINWCTYDPNKPCTEVPNPNPNATLNAPQNLQGPIVSPAGTPAPWNPTNVPLAPGQPSHNFAQYYDGNPNAVPAIPNIANNNCFKYKQIIKIVDTQDPTVTNCPASPVEFCDNSANDPLLWNQMYWWDAGTESHDLCEGDAPLTITATDACSGANINITYLLFLDLDGDGTMETVVNSNNPPAPGTVNYNNLGTPNYAGGTPRVFDGRPVLPNDIYRWANHQSVSGTSRTASVQWKTFAQLPTPNNQLGTPGIAPQLPYGTHKIKWTITDGCGNENFCEYQFVVKDCKAPTVVCFNGLSVNIMPGGMIAMWATDFLQYSEDNCTPTAKLKYAIRKAGQGTGFPVDALGNPITSVTFDCSELGPQPVELWAQDLAGNAAFCQTFIDVQDPSGACSNNITVSGALKTETNDGLEDANVNVQAGIVSHFDMTDDQGQYSFDNAVPANTNYTVTPTKDDNPLNGVSTFDLVLISKHILGLEPLGSPYKMIAADANKSNSITTFDIVEIRKLILGIYTELPNNTSWRFVDKAFAFPNAANPFATQFPETKSVAGTTLDQLNDDFVAVKVGDVNNTAIANSLLGGDDRSAGTLMFDVEERAVKAGETFAVTFKAAERSQGFQFTLNLAGLEVASISSTSDKVSADNFGVFADALTTSVDGDATDFTVTFRATKSGNLSEMLGVSSRITRAEAYSLANNRMDVALRFNGGAGSVISGVGFELYQNQPNPFVNKTVIGFHLPQAAEATLTIFDETGRMLFTQKGAFAKGYNAISVDRALLNTTGLMYYKLETSSDAATKKMIQTK